MNKSKTEQQTESEKVAENIKKEIVQRITRNLLDIQILRLLSAEPMWGYKIKKEVETKFGVKLRHGALYPLLNAMEQKGLLESKRQQQGGRARKVYTITERGREYIEAYDGILKEQIRRKDIQ
ncbi:MAG: PadR family transcriptional regulator [Candidatus Bathyarchaeales archaeon]